jgi:hypothetical protein
MGKDTGLDMLIGITSVGLTRFPVAAGCSVVGIGRPSVCIGPVTFGDRRQDRNVALFWVRSGDTATPLVRHQPPHNPRNLFLKAEGFT